MKSDQAIYFDHNATTPMDSRVREVMLPYLDTSFGNASSVHSFGQHIRFAIDNARVKVARLLNAEPEEIIFTSGGTESCNLAIQGVARQHASDFSIFCSAVEHPAVLKCVEFLQETTAAKVSFLNVQNDGQLDMLSFRSLLSRTPPTFLSVMTANNDVGTIMPINDICKAAHDKGTLVHSDAVQAVGKIPIDVKDMQLDLLSCSAHKLQGPTGAGALYIKRGTRISPILFGGHQERRYRAGTENVAAIVGFGKACEIAKEELEHHATAVAQMKNRLEAALLSFNDVTVYGLGSPRLPGTCYAGFSGIEGDTLQMALDMAGFAVSVGSACSSELREPSHVLTAMGVHPRDAASAIRFSIGPTNTTAEIDQLVIVLHELVKQLRC